MKKLSLILLVLLLVAAAFTLTACGGDGTTDNTGGGNTGSGYTVYCFKDEAGGAATEVKVSGESGNSIPPATKAHYTFLGYYTAEGVQFFDAAGKQTEGLLIDKNITVYARFAPINYTVSFVVGEGALPTGMTTTATLNANAWQLAAPVPAASAPTLQFEGWYNKDFTVCYVDKNGIVDYTKFSLNNGLTIENGEIKLYAKYGTRTVKVTLIYNDVGYENVELDVVYGNVVGDLTAHKKQDETAKREVVGFSTSRYELTPPSGALYNDIELFAIWKNYKHVKFVYGPDDERVAKVYDGGIQGAELPVAVKPGYSFDGWYPSSALSGNPVEYVSFSALADRYYAKFTLTDYTLTFVTGTADVLDPITYFYGDTDALPELSRTGYNFLGWSMEQDGTGEVLYNIPVDLYGNYTLYAVWEAESYVVELKGNGGTVSSAQEFVSYNSSYQLTPAVREGYNFLGWFAGPEAGAAQYTNARGLALAVWSATEGTTLYAHWEICTYTVNLNLNGGALSGSKSQRYQHGSVLRIPTALPVKSGLMFDGWYNANFTKEYTGIIAVTENMTLYAKWVESKAISTVEGLKAIADNPAGTYHLTTDINLLGDVWTPIAEFTGTLNGNGHKIYAFSMTYNADATNVWADFGFVAVNKGTIKNLTFDELSITCVQTVSGYGGMDLGAFVGQNHGVILNCHLTDTVTFNANFTTNDVRYGVYVYTVRVGGIAGVSTTEGDTLGLITSCTSAAVIASHMNMQHSGQYLSNETAYLETGGIAGATTGGCVISACTFSGSINSTHVVNGKGNDTMAQGSGATGGIVAANGGTAAGCAFTGSVYIGQAFNVSGGYKNGPHTTCDIGGIAAFNGGTITQCKSVGTVHSQAHRNAAGGIASVNGSDGEINNSYSTATVTANGGNLHTYAGACVAQNQGRIRMCYTAGTVTTEFGHNVGGFVGQITSTGTIAYCYSATNVNKGGSTNHCLFVGTLNGTVSASAAAADVDYILNGTAATPQATAGVTLKQTSAELFTADHLLNTLYWQTADWHITGEAHPTLFWEVNTEALIEHED